MVLSPLPCRWPDSKDRVSLPEKAPRTWPPNLFPPRQLAHPSWNRLLCFSSEQFPACVSNSPFCWQSPLPGWQQVTPQSYWRPHTPSPYMPPSGPHACHRPPPLCRSQHVEYLMSGEHFHLLTQAK